MLLRPEIKTYSLQVHLIDLTYLLTVVVTINKSTSHEAWPGGLKVKSDGEQEGTSTMVVSLIQDKLFLNPNSLDA